MNIKLFLDMVLYTYIAINENDFVMIIVVVLFPSPINSRTVVLHCICFS